MDINGPILQNDGRGTIYIPNGSDQNILFPRISERFTRVVEACGF